MNQERDLFTPVPPPPPPQAVLDITVGEPETARIPWVPPPTAADIRKAFEEPTPGLSLEDRFNNFHASNPTVYEALVKYAREAKGKGHPRLGIRMLWERARWELTVDVKDPAGARPRMNDHYCPLYARKIMAQEKDLAGLFELREMADPAERKG